MKTAIIILILLGSLNIIAYYYNKTKYKELNIYAAGGCIGLAIFLIINF